MNIGKSLKMAMLEKGVSQKDFALAMDITPIHANVLANNKSNPTVATLEKAADFFGLKVSEFIALGEE